MERSIPTARQHASHSPRLSQIKNAPDHHWRGRFLFSCQALEEAELVGVVAHQDVLRLLVVVKHHLVGFAANT